jgi:hypothetical protein
MQRIHSHHARYRACHARASDDSPSRCCGETPCSCGFARARPQLRVARGDVRFQRLRRRRIARRFTSGRRDRAPDSI